MNSNIRLKIESQVIEAFEDLDRLNPTEDGYYSARNSIVKDINILVELLQKDDVNESNSKFNMEKIKNEITKIEKEHEINLKKIECEVTKNKDNLNLEKDKIKNSYEIDNKKIENDIAKIDNELRKIIDDKEINNRKIECDIDKIKNDVIKINQDYEINKDKIQIEITKNKDNLHLETRKIDNAEIKNNSDVDLKNKELDLNAKHDIEQRRDRVIKVLVDGATVIVPIIFYNVWMNRGFEFEETGTFTSNTFKNLFNKFKPGK
jgi:hypothetical protein